MLRILSPGWRNAGCDLKDKRSVLSAMWAVLSIEQRFCLTPSVGMVYRGAGSCQIRLERAERGQKAGERQKSAGNQVGLILLRMERKSREMFRRRLSSKINIFIDPGASSAKLFPYIFIKRWWVVV